MFSSENAPQSQFKMCAGSAFIVNPNVTPVSGKSGKSGKNITKINLYSKDGGNTFMYLL
jgi:hypothetical protein